MNLKIEVFGYAVKNHAGDVFGIYETQEHAELAIVSIGPWFGELFVKQTLVARQMSDPCAKLKSNERLQMTPQQTIRYNELMRIAKGNEFMSMTEFDELCALMKIRGYH